MYDITIVGCGIIGASLAYKLSQYDLNVLVLEKENDVAMGATRANSAIVHAGYDPEPGTLISKLNVRGSEMMEALCKKLDVKYKRIGSLVIAFDENDVKHLEKLYDNGIKNGVPGIKILNNDETHKIEPNLSNDVCASLYAPSAAIIDPWGLCIAQAETAVRNGVTIKLRSGVIGLEQHKNYITVHTKSKDYQTKYIINCAGGWGHEICSLTGDTEWSAMPSRGEYYLLDKSSGSLVNHVIFQCPTAAGKGVLVTQTVHGNLLIGPNAEPVKSPYNRETSLDGLDAVASASRKSVNGIDLRQSIRTFAGVRAITSENDFIIRPAKSCPNMLHAAGIKSPGLSSAPAIAEYAVDVLTDMGVSFTPKKIWAGTRKQIRFKELSRQEKDRLIAEDARYGRVICRCETITEGEIVSAIHSPIPPCSIDGIKRRAGTGMGRCQGGFCGPRVLDILARELKKNPIDIPKDGDESNILIGETKGGAQI